MFICNKTVGNHFGIQTRNKLRSALVRNPAKLYKIILSKKTYIWEKYIKTELQNNLHKE